MKFLINIQETRNLTVVGKIYHLQNDKLANDSLNCDTKFYIKQCVCLVSLRKSPEKCIACWKVVSDIILHKLIRRVQNIIVERFLSQTKLAPHYFSFFRLANFYLSVACKNKQYVVVECEGLTFKTYAQLLANTKQMGVCYF